ncbi:hypothetical protein GO308_09640 [Sphingomonas sp. SFZ2018-12]|uniref:hypothetical protein n=1 Tax=Sphingomonas sp. SFZ2018-12 TaxID=2683197 RepID=UPI0008313E51|nr:hypothetical protein [Sphingomonas sp. SFZ2018-12]MCH4893370.1 hypothetical protein [Sphingomonas sp. SFZ2018-12]
MIGKLRAIAGMTGLFRYVSIALGIALVAAVIWGWNERSLHHYFRGIVERTILVIPEAERPKPGELHITVKDILSDRSIAREESRQRGERIQTLSDANRQLKDEGLAARGIAERNWQLYQSAKAQRDQVIARSKQAATRTERKSCEQELKELEEVMDALRADGF